MTETEFNKKVINVYNKLINLSPSGSINFSSMCGAVQFELGRSALAQFNKYQPLISRLLGYGYWFTSISSIKGDTWWPSANTLHKRVKLLMRFAEDCRKSKVYLEWL